MSRQLYGNYGQVRSRKSTSEIPAAPSELQMQAAELMIETGAPVATVSEIAQSNTEEAPTSSGGKVKLALAAAATAAAAGAAHYFGMFG